MSSHLFSCENATCAVPSDCASLFSGHGDLLSSADGWEPGALNLAQACAMRFRTPLVHAETSRLLLDVERDEEHCLSRFSEALGRHDKNRLLDRYWRSYRNQLHHRIRADMERHGLVIHVLIHTNPDQREHVLLSSPKQSDLANRLADRWMNCIQRDELRCRHQSEWEGNHLSRELGQSYPSDRYVQIRLSVHQDFFLTGVPWQWATIKKHLLDALALSVQTIENTNAAPQGSVVPAEQVL